jgi:hypothetical protein
VLIHLPIFFVRTLRRSRVALALPLVALCCLLLTTGCERLRHGRHDRVYVAVRTTYLHDRVAPVSNRVGQVVNGQELEVLERRKRFLRVQTDKKEIGWIEERAVISAADYARFEQLAKDHKDDPVAATATLRDDLAMHVMPGRDTERFYLLAGNSKVQLLVRATAPRKSADAASQPAPGTPKPAETGKAAAAGATAKPGAQQAPATPVTPEPEPPQMEDWWLARDPQGRVGWMLSNRLDVDAPYEVAQYAEGQRIVGAWTLAKVVDPEAETANHEIGEYLMMLAPMKSGLPYDFDQVRVFTWSMKRHRYETAFRLHPIQGFLPVRIYTQETPKGGVPAFSFVIAGDNNVATNPETGISRPSNPRTISYEMLDTRVQRIGPDLAPLPAQPTQPDNAGKKGTKAQRQKR